MPGLCGDTVSMKTDLIFPIFWSRKRQKTFARNNPEDITFFFPKYHSVDAAVRKKDNNICF